MLVGLYADRGTPNLVWYYSPLPLREEYTVTTAETVQKLWFQSHYFTRTSVSDPRLCPNRPRVLGVPQIGIQPRRIVESTHIKDVSDFSPLAGRRGPGRFHYIAFFLYHIQVVGTTIINDRIHFWPCAINISEWL